MSIQADKTMDISTQCQLVLVIRYIDKPHDVRERFFEFISLQSATADSIATAPLNRLSSILPDGQKSKLISQAYDSASERSHRWCTEEKSFFSDLAGFSVFFYKISKENQCA